MESTGAQPMACDRSDEVDTPRVVEQKQSDSTAVDTRANVQQDRSDSSENVRAVHREPSCSTEKTRATKSKVNYCRYCETLQTKLSRHLANKHSDVPEVQKYLQTTDPNSMQQKKKRREFCKTIVNNHNRIYNEKVVNGEELGKPIPVKRGKTEVSTISHAVCSVCGGLIAKKYFSSHMNTCKTRQSLFGSANTDRGRTLKSTFLRPALAEKYKPLETHIFNKMVKDEVSYYAQTDPLILEFGRRFFKSHKAEKQRNYVSNKMRTLAQLLIRLKKVDPTNIKRMSDCLDPTNFDNLCSVVREWSDYNEDDGVCAKGSVPRRICKSLKMCSQVLWSEAIKDKTLSVQEQLEIRTKHERFMALMDSDWTMEVNSAADKSMKIQKVSKEDKMPLTDDIQVYFKEMTAKIEKSTHVLKKTHKLEEYTALTKACIAYLILFNCRRPSEVTYATLENYSTLKSSPDNVTGDGSLAVFTVAATKNDVKVPVLVPSSVRTAICTLIEHRTLLNIKGNLLFGKEDGTAYNGSEIIYKFKSEINLKKPDHFTANGFRHYWATVSQLDPGVKQHMPKFLGHTLAVHEKFYEMPMSDIHLQVIGPLLTKRCLRGCENTLDVKNQNPTPGTSGTCFQTKRNTSDDSLSAAVHQISSSEDVDSSDDEIINTVQSQYFRYKARTTSDTFCPSTRQSPNHDGPSTSSQHALSSSDEEEEEEYVVGDDDDDDETAITDRPPCSGNEVSNEYSERLRPREKSSIEAPGTSHRSTSSDKVVEVDSVDNNTDVTGFNARDCYSTPPKKRQSRRKKKVVVVPSGQRCTDDDDDDDSSDSSDEESIDSPLCVGRRNKWLTPERQELFNSLPRTVLGFEHAGRGKIKMVWENSTLIRRRHSLQTTRIEVSKYFTRKKKVSTPIRQKMLDDIKKNE